MLYYVCLSLEEFLEKESAIHSWNMDNNVVCADKWANEWKHPTESKWLLPLPDNYVEIIGDVTTINDISDWYYNPDRMGL